MKNKAKAGLLVLALLFCLVTKLFARDSWGVYCYDEKYWIGRYYSVQEANKAYHDHVEGSDHIVNVLRCATWNDDCTKDLSH